MKTIESNTLGHQPIKLGEESGQLDIYDGCKTPISEDVIVLTQYHTKQIESYALQAAGKYGDKHGTKEPTYVQTEHGLPALVVRIDCTINNGEVRAYEMEDSPSGLGITDKLNRHITGTGIRGAVLNHYQTITGSTPQVIVSGTRRHGTDDEMLVGVSNYHYHEGEFTLPSGIEDKLVIVKAIPGDASSHKPYLHLQERALAPLVTEGDKTYAERIGQVTPICSENELLQEDEQHISQVIKARLGSMAMGITIYLSPSDRKLYGKRGQASIGRLLRNMQHYVEECDGALLQKFQPPIRIENDAGRNNAILRIFVLLTNTNGETEAQAIGGCYVARPELIVHGASNAVSGAVLVE